jgi:hypothetical protein
VFLLGLDSQKIAEWAADAAKNMTNVAVTRARDQLYMPYTRDTALIGCIMKSN